MPSKPTVLTAAVFTVLLLWGAPWFDQSWAELTPAHGYEPWRLLLGHWVHHAWSHLVLNAVALVGWLWLWPESGPSMFAKVVLMSLAVGAAVVCCSDADYVVGLSGLLHALFVASPLRRTLEGSGQIHDYAALVLVFLKIIYETTYGALPGTSELAGLPVATEAHLSGGIAGAVYALASYAAVRARRSV